MALLEVIAVGVGTGMQPSRTMTTHDEARQDRRVTRATDKRMPVEDLPYPIGTRHADHPPDDNRLWGDVGDQAVFECIGLRPQIAGATGAENRAAGGQLNRQMYEGLREAFRSITDIEIGTTGSPASMTNAEDFDSFRSRGWQPAFDDDAHFFVFRSRDGEWAGFRWRNESFRFKRASLLGMCLGSALPARSSGGFEIWCVCVPRSTPGPKAHFGNVEATTVKLCDRWTAEVGFELMCVMTRITNFLGTAFNAYQVADV
ncbi:hypothetical protein [Paraburkholderia graminis]|uniref:hypothetical protein n=1 Tax=Paraburkholderia graminis TaxID=60548 RepID=UPI0038B8A6D0